MSSALRTKLVLFLQECHSEVAFSCSTSTTTPVGSFHIELTPLVTPEHRGDRGLEVGPFPTSVFEVT